MRCSRTALKLTATICFFFSSRRRHTRCGRDWSSDVCSSDLLAMVPNVRSEPRTFGTIANNFATQSRMALLNRTESSQQQFVTLTGDKIADAEYDTGRQRIRFWIENIWINSVVNHWS